MRWLLLCFVTACWSQASSTTAPPPTPKKKEVEIVQPVKIEKQEVRGEDPCGDFGDPGDPCGGVVGGVVGHSRGVAPPPPPPPPPPPAPPQNIPPNLLEGHRIAGIKEIVPDDPTKVEIQQAGKTKIVGSYKLCVTATGMVSSVSQLKSTGFGAYDAKLQSEMRYWRYRPFLVNGNAVPVCTAVTFIYSQAAPPPPKP